MKEQIEKCCCCKSSSKIKNVSCQLDVKTKEQSKKIWVIEAVKKRKRK